MVMACGRFQSRPSTFPSCLQRSTGTFQRPHILHPDFFSRFPSRCPRIRRGEQYRKSAYRSQIHARNFSILSSISSLVKSCTIPLIDNRLRTLFPHPTIQQQGIIDCTFAFAKCQAVNTEIDDITTLHHIQDAAHMLRHFIALYEESPSSVISRQDERLGETVRMLERNVCYLVEVLHLKAQLFGLHVEDFVRSDRVGRETKKVADIFVSALVERKHALESAEVPSTITRADLDRLLQLQEGLARLFIQEAQIREGANFKVQAWIDRSETNHREQVCKLREFLELEQKLPAGLRLGKYQTSLYKSRLWGLEKIDDLGM